MKKQKKNDLYIPDPVLLHIFSYQHGSLCNMVQKKLSKYAKADYVFGITKMPISLILSSDLLMEFFKDILITKMKIPGSITPNWVSPSIILVAARYNNLQAMKWLESNILHATNATKKIIIWDAVDRTCNAIASTGCLYILRWALDRGCPWDVHCVSTCARGGHMEMFRWILDERFFINVVGICSGAASGGHLQLLQLAREYELPWDENTFHCAAQSGNIQLMKWARINGCRWDANTCTAAARLGKLEILQWLREENCPWDAKTCAVAAQRAHLHVLEWARSRECPCPWDEGTCSAAAKYGHLQILQWAREKGCSWDERTCSAAAMYGHLQILQWAREKGCPWDKGTCEGAARQGNLEILQWARENGCPWDEETTSIAAQCHSLDVLCWAIENGCPINFNECMRIMMNSCDSERKLYPCARCFRDIWEGDLANYNKWKSGCPMNSSACLKAANSNRWQRLMSWVACEALVPANID